MTYLLKEISNTWPTMQSGIIPSNNTLSSPKLSPPKDKDSKGFFQAMQSGTCVSTSLDPTQHPVARQHGSTGGIILQSRSQGIGTSGKTYII